MACHLDHVFLDTGRVTTPKNTEQFIIRDEEETWKCVSLGVQVVIKALLAPLQTNTQGLKVC